jgi:hypothetical protein
MVETESDEYNLMSKERKQSLRVSLINNQEILMIVTNLETQQKYSSLVSLPKLRQLCQIFNTIQTPSEALSILKKCIESNGIILIEDLEDNYIELKYTIKMEGVEYPTFDINLYMENQEEEKQEEENIEKEEDVQVLDPIFDYKGNIEAQVKYGNTSKDTTEFAKPIVQSNVKPPVLEIEIIEPIVQTHYPDGTTKKTALKPRIQGPGGQAITEDQVKYIEEQMDTDEIIRNFSPLRDILRNNRSNSVANKRRSIYSTQSIPENYNYNIMEINPYDNAVRPANQATQTQIVNNMQTINYHNYMTNSFNNSFNDFKRTTSEYSTMSLPNKPFILPNINYTAQFPNPSIQNNGFNRINLFHSQNPNQNNRIIEKRPRMINSNNPRDGVRSSSTPHEKYDEYTQNSNIDVYQPNLVYNPYNTIQTEYQPSKVKKYPWDRNTQKVSLPAYNTNYKQNLAQDKVPKNQIRSNPKINNAQQLKYDSRSTNVAQIQLQKQRLKEVQDKLALVQLQQQQIKSKQKEIAFQHQQFQNIPKRRINHDLLNNQTNPPILLRQQNKNIQKKTKNNTIDNGPVNHNKKKKIPMTSKKPIKQIKSLNDNSNFIMEHAKTQMSGFRSQISTPLPTTDNFSQQLLNYAQMASMQNEINPQFKDLQAITLEEKHQQIQSTEDEEYRPKEYLQEKEYQEVGDEGQAFADNANINQNSRQVDPTAEEVFITEQGRVIFRNGLLRGIIHRYAEIDEVVAKIQDILSKGVKFSLVYKAFDMGDKASIFHEKCDKLKMSLVLIETDKDVRFGGFTRRSWEGNCIKKTDNNAFVFSLDNNTIYDVIKNEPAIGCYPKFGPVFFGCQIRIYDECFTEGGTTCRKGLNYRTKKDFELNHGKQNYLIKDIEVYNIETVNI